MKDKTIYILRHEYELDHCDEMKILGVYSERRLAEQSQSRFALEEGFRNHPQGFVIHETELDKELWSGGFITYRYHISD